MNTKGYSISAGAHPACNCSSVRPALTVVLGFFGLNEKKIFIQMLL